MKTAVAALLLLFSSIVSACDGWVIGFRGLNGAFDEQAFKSYAQRLGYCAQAYGWNQQTPALKKISKLTTPYHLYGYSKGAESVKLVLDKLWISESPMPQYIITIGAWRSVNLDFYEYAIPFSNYFDNSGRGQRSPGVFLSVEHHRMQKEVNRRYYPSIVDD